MDLNFKVSFIIAVETYICPLHSIRQWAPIDFPEIKEKKQVTLPVSHYADIPMSLMATEMLQNTSSFDDLPTFPIHKKIIFIFFPKK
jgi:hypothetical protein